MIVAAQIFAVVIGAFTSPPWPSSAWFREKDVLVLQTFDAINERNCAIYQAQLTPAPSFYRSERDELVRFKSWVTNNARYFADMSQASTNGSFDDWFSRPIVTTNQFYGYVVTSRNDRLPVLSETALVSRLSLPTNYFRQTPYRQLNGGGVASTTEWTQAGRSTLEYGWSPVPAIVSQLVRTVDVAGPWVVVDAGGSGIVSNYPQQTAESQIEFWFFDTYEGEAWDGRCPIPAPLRYIGGCTNYPKNYQQSMASPTNAFLCSSPVGIDYYVRAGKLGNDTFAPGSVCTISYSDFAVAPDGYVEGIWRRAASGLPPATPVVFGTNAMPEHPTACVAPGDSRFWSAAFDTGPAGQAYEFYNRAGWRAPERPLAVMEWGFAYP